MDSRVEAVLQHIESDQSFPCTPAKRALKWKTLLTPDSFDPSGSSLSEGIHQVIEEVFKEGNEGALLVSEADPDLTKGVLGLMPTVAPLVRNVRTAIQNIAAPAKVETDKWESVLSGMGTGNIRAQWPDRQAQNKYEGLLITAHGPPYPHTHPRYQPHPALAVIKASVLSTISPELERAIADRAMEQADIEYSTDCFLPPLTWKRAF